MDVEANSPPTEDKISHLIKVFPPDLQNSIKDWVKYNFSELDLPILVNEIKSNTLALEIHGLIGIRKLLSKEGNPPIQAVVENGLVTYFINFAKLQGQPYVQCEAVWCLTNITSGTSEQTRWVVEQGGINLFCELLHSEFHEVVEQSIWALGNLAGDSNEYRDIILEKGVLEKLLHIVPTIESKVEFDSGMWTIANLCRGRPSPKIELVEAAGPVLCSLLPKCEADHTFLDVAWALATLSEENRDNRRIIPTEAIPVLFELLKKFKRKFIPCMNIFTNIFGHTEEQADILINLPDFIPTLLELLDQEKIGNKRKVIFKVFEAITSRNSQGKELLVANPYWLKQLIVRISNSDIDRAGKPGVFSLAHLAKDWSPQIAKRLFKKGALKLFVHFLKDKDTTQDPVQAGLLLDAVYGMLKNGPKKNENNTNPLLVQLEAENGIVAIEELQLHPNQEVFYKALRILEEFIME